MFDYGVLYRLEDAALEPPEDNRRKVCRCSLCKEDILEGDEFFSILNRNICAECVEEARQCAEIEY